MRNSLSFRSTEDTINPVRSPCMLSLQSRCCLRQVLSDSDKRALYDKKTGRKSRVQFYGVRSPGRSCRRWWWCWCWRRCW